jgi:dTDP-4-dehydrorhamnose reductase
MKRVLLIGGNGMLGSEIALKFAKLTDISLVMLNRATHPTFDAASPDSSERVLNSILANEGIDVVINTVGATKVNISETALDEAERVANVNSVFPRLVGQLASDFGVHVLTVATDCVFSGRSGPYSESSIHDPTDLYGKTKSAGELIGQGVTVLRTSFIGLQRPGSTPMLLEWLLGQPTGARINGYSNHRWNGVTTAVVARLFTRMIAEDFLPSGTFHLVPNYEYSKLDLLCEIAEIFGRDDLAIVPTQTPEFVDRRLGTDFPEVNLELWRLLGQAPPTAIRASILELAERRLRESN